MILPKGNISKRHSRIVLKDGKFIIVDLKSTNGTYVNGKKITAPRAPGKDTRNDPCRSSDPNSAVASSAPDDAVALDRQGSFLVSFPGARSVVEVRPGKTRTVVDQVR